MWLPPRPTGEFLGEGDTGTYFDLIGNGLEAYRDETPGGWGGHVVVNPSARADRRSVRQRVDVGISRVANACC